MRILELHCNPRPASFTGSLAARAREALVAMGHELVYHDLYDEGFDPILTAEELARGFSLEPLVQEHSAALAEAQGIVVVHPDWWGGPPALLKGWIDRVFRQGVAYELVGEDFTEKAFSPLLGGKRALIICTTDASDQAAAGQLETFWSRALGACGVESRCRVFRQLRSFGTAERSLALDEAAALAAASFPLPATERRGGPSQT